MNPLSRLRTFAIIGGLIVAVAAGGLAGVALGERASRPDTVEVVVPDPALIPEADIAVRSAGGFTGFEGAPALSGHVVRVGAFELAADEVRVVQDGAAVDIALRTPARLLLLGAAASPLVPGDVVIVRYEGDEAAAVLRVPPDLHERESPPPRPERGGAPG